MNQTNEFFTVPLWIYGSPPSDLLDRMLEWPASLCLLNKTLVEYSRRRKISSLSIFKEVLYYPWNSELKLWKFPKNRFSGILRTNYAKRRLVTILNSGCAHSVIAHDPLWGFKTARAPHFINLFDQRFLIPRVWENGTRKKSISHLPKLKSFMSCIVFY